MFLKIYRSGRDANRPIHDIHDVTGRHAWGHFFPEPFHPRFFGLIQALHIASQNFWPVTAGKAVQSWNTIISLDKAYLSSALLITSFMPEEVG